MQNGERSNYIVWISKDSLTITAQENNPFIYNLNACIANKGVEKWIDRYGVQKALKL